MATKIKKLEMQFTAASEVDDFTVEVDKEGVTAIQEINDYWRIWYGEYVGKLISRKNEECVNFWLEEVPEEPASTEDEAKEPAKVVDINEAKKRKIKRKL